MKNEVTPLPCSECGGQIRRRSISQEFEREGVRVTVSGIQAQVCDECGEVYFEPGGAQALVEAVNRLFELAHKNRQHKGVIAAAVA